MDPNIPLPDRQLAGKSFMEAKECCLDGHFGKRLRKLVKSWEDLFEDDLHFFLRTMFSRTVVTSTFVEGVFSDLSCWTRSRRLSMSSLASKHVVESFREGVQLA